MPSPYLIDFAPNADTFGIWYPRYNSAVDEILSNIQLVGTDLEFTRYDGFQWIIPTGAFGADRILSGLDVSITGAGPYDATVTPGTWLIGGVIYNLAAPAVLPIGAADPLLDRLDIIVAGPANGDVTLIAGTPASSPVAPTVPPGELLVSIISIPAAGVPVVNPPLALPAGTQTGQTLRWNQSAGIWQLSEVIRGTQVSPNSSYVYLDGVSGNARLEVSEISGQGYIRALVDDAGGAPLTRSDLLLEHDIMRLRFTPDTTNLAQVNEIRIDNVGILIETDQTGDGVSIRADGQSVNVDGNSVNLQTINGARRSAISLSSSLNRISNRDDAADPLTEMRIDINANSEVITLKDETGITDGRLDIDLKGGVRLVHDGAPVNAVNRLYRIGSDLYFNGLQICQAPCGGGATVDYDVLYLQAPGSPHSLPWSGAPLYVFAEVNTGNVSVNLPPASAAKKIITIKRIGGWGTGVTPRLIVNTVGGSTIGASATSDPITTVDETRTYVYDPGNDRWWPIASFVRLDGRDYYQEAIDFSDSPYQMSVLEADVNRILNVDTTGGIVNVDLPNILQVNSTITIKKIAGANNINVNGNVGNIDGAIAVPITGTFTSLTVYGDPVTAQWYTI